MKDRTKCELFKNGVDQDGNFCRSDCDCGEKPSMMRGKYRGDLPVLQNEIALLRIIPEEPDKILAQFDNFGLWLKDECLAFGWHKFPLLDFEIDDFYGVNNE